MTEDSWIVPNQTEGYLTPSRCFRTFADANAPFVRTTVNYRLLALPLLLSASLAACGDDGDDVKMEVIAPGEECAEGGFRVFVDGEAFVSCTQDGQGGVTAENLPAGADANSCIGEAILFTIHTEEGAQQSLVCKDLDDSVFNENNRTFANVIRTVFETIMAQNAVQNECYNSDSGINELYQDLMERHLDTFERCAASVYNSFEHTSDLQEYLECGQTAEQGRLGCVSVAQDAEGNPIDVCDDLEYNNAYSECASEFNADAAACAEEFPEQAMQAQVFAMFTQATCMQYLMPFGGF